MIIRSQDKTCITNMGQVTDVLCNESRKGDKYNITAILASGDTTHLGKYNTRETAIKVLDMIQEAYQEPIYQNDIGCNEIAIYKNTVFQMPKDEEVEE